MWKQFYDFAAVPPTPEGDRIARDLLDKAWPRYAAALPAIRRGAAGIVPSPERTLEQVAGLLKPDAPAHLELIAYIGAFEDNAFTVAAEPGRPKVAIPVEMDARTRGPIMAHEFTHAVQIDIGTMRGGWERSVGETVLAEGLAMRVAQRLYPDRPALSFVEMTPGWFARCEGMRAAILRDIRAAAASSKSDDVMRFTMGNGPSGVDREAYYAGWLVVDYWRRRGWGFDRIVRIPEAEAPAEVSRAIDGLLAETPGH